eukprot:TRINITY_DN8884_c0_g1_i1.p1 TRINITY_DN8884_c0_g1~~TRINITY_DN8884_c0_g1_i1.p1  ORF type:complete len:253 (+),score=22.94 TRINITY_DN8884_c0_g1_i1:22-759(+)
METYTNTPAPTLPSELISLILGYKYHQYLQTMQHRYQTMSFGSTITQLHKRYSREHCLDYMQLYPGNIGRIDVLKLMRCNPEYLFQYLLITKRTVIPMVDCVITHCARFFPSFIPELVKNGYNINDTSRLGNTPLMLVVRYHPQYVQMLIELGADVNQNERGNTVLMLACRFQPEVVRLLVNAGADVNFVNDIGNGVLSHACDYNPGVIKWLLEGDLDVDLPNRNGATALSILCSAQPFSRSWSI